MSDPAAELERLRAELAATRAELTRARAIVSTSEAMIAGLKREIALLRREKYGHSAERTARLIDQLELQLEELVTAAAEDRVRAERTTVATFERRKPVRKPFPEHLPRERVVVEAPKACTCCGSDRIVKMGEDITETLEGLRPFLPQTVHRTVCHLRRTGANFRASGKSFRPSARSSPAFVGKTVPRTVFRPFSPAKRSASPRRRSTLSAAAGPVRASWR